MSEEICSELWNTIQICWNRKESKSWWTKFRFLNYVTPNNSVNISSIIQILITNIHTQNNLNYKYRKFEPGHITSCNEPCYIIQLFDIYEGFNETLILLAINLPLSRIKEGVDVTLSIIKSTLTWFVSPFTYVIFIKSKQKFLRED